VTALLDLVPGSIGPDTWRAEVGARLAAGALASLPPAAIAAYDLAQVSLQTAGGLAAALSSGSALASVSAVGAAIAALASAGRLLAAKLDQATADEIDRGLAAQAGLMIGAADGRILAPYQTGSPITGAPPGEHRVYTALGSRTASDVAAAWTPGAVAVVPRGARRGCVWSLAPWAVPTRGGEPLTPGIWGADTGPTIALVYDRSVEGGLTEAAGVRRALDRGEWPSDWLTRSPVGEWTPGAGHWTVRLVEASERSPSVPALCRRVLAPGLAPVIGPFGEPCPVAGELLAYAAGLGAVPPPDLDAVIATVRAREAGLVGLPPPPLAAQIERLRVLAWSREHLRRSRGEAPRPWDPWEGPDRGPALEVLVRGPGALADLAPPPPPPSSSGDDGATLLAGALGVGLLALLARRR
jgi:hypothetical protein